MWVHNVREGPKWLPGTISDKTGPVSYEVTVNGQVWRRRAEQLIKRTGSQPPMDTDTMEGEESGGLGEFPEDTTSELEDVPDLEEGTVPAEPNTGTARKMARIYSHVVRTENAGKAFRQAVEIAQSQVLMTRLNNAISPSDAHAIDVRYHKVCWTRHVFHVLRDDASNQEKCMETPLPMTVSAYLDESVPAYGANGSVCAKTVRSSHCELMTDQDNCSNCIAYTKNLRALHARNQKESIQSKHERVEASSHTNYRYLSSPEKKARMTNLNKGSSSKWINYGRRLKI